MAQGKSKLKKSSGNAKKKQQVYKNQASKSKRGQSSIIPAKKFNVQQQQKVMKSLTKAINAKAEIDLKARSFQSDGKSFKVLGKVDRSKEAAKGAGKNKKVKTQRAGKKNKK